MSHRKGAIAFGVLMACSASAQITNGGFEANGGSLQGWTTVRTNADLLASSDYSFEGTHSCRYDVATGQADSDAYIEQSIGSIAVNDIHALLIAGLAPGGQQDLKAWFFYSDNTHTDFTHTFDHGGDNLTWQQWDMTSLLTSGKTLTGLRFEVDAGQFDSRDDLYVDAVRIRSVPEPSSIAGLGLGAVALIRRRRKRAI